MMELYPVSLKLTDDRALEIGWNDGRTLRCSVARLRDACPCATCREKRREPPKASTNLLPVLSAAEARPLTILGMKPVGTYAYSIRFSDEHDSGIYAFDLLRSLGDEET